MDVGALSLLIGESGFAATMEKAAQLDAAYSRLGQRTASVRVDAPNANRVQAALAGIEETMAIIARPVVINSPFEPLVAGAVPATRAITALAEAQAGQAARAATLTQALERASATEATAAERAALLKSALDQDQVATDALSAATLKLDIAQRDGIAIMQLRARALTELREAQNQLAREESLASGNYRVRAAPLTTGTPNITAGRELGPATAEAEAFAQRSAATKAGFEQQARAAMLAAAEIEAYEENARRASAETEKMSPRVRSAANGIAALAFALTAGEPSFQSFALGAGLVGTSLADAFGSAKLATYASGIGAVLVVVGTFVGVLERMTDRASRARTAIDSVLASIRGMRSSSEATAALTTAMRDLAQAEKELAAARERLSRGGSPDALSIGRDIAAFRQLQKVVDQYAEIRMAAAHQVAVTEIEERDARARANREVLVQELSAEARARDAAQQARVAKEQVDFDTGRTSLDQFLKARLDLIRDSAQREIAVLRARQDALAAPDPNAKAGDAERRAGEIRSLNREIQEIQARTRQQETETNDQIGAQREALDRQIIAFQMKEQEAAGDASNARIKQSQLEAVAIERALVQDSGATTPDEIAQAWKDASAAAGQYVATQTTVIRAQQQQQAAQRIFNGLEIERLTIQQQLARGDITQAEANAQLAAAERARVDDLTKIATEMERFGRALNNEDLINAARRLRAEIDGLGRAPLGAVAQRVKEVSDALSMAAADGDRVAEGFLRQIEQLRAAGKPIPLSLVLEAGWWLDIKQQIDDGLARLEFMIKPKNIKLAGVAGAIDQLNQEFSGLALNVGNSIGTSLAAGFSSAFTKGSGKNFMEAFGNTLLSSIGGIMVQLGSSMLAYAAIMTVAAPLLALTPFAGASIGAAQAAITGAALIALGSGMGAIAANNSGSRTGGGGGRGGSALQSRSIPTQQTILDPDRHARERLAQRPEIAQRAAVAPAQPIVNHFNMFGDPTPQSQRFIAANSRGADGRNIPIVRRRR